MTLASGERVLPCRWLDVATHNGEIALDIVEPGNAWQQSPAFKAEALEQFQARFIVREDQANHGVDPERRRTSDCFFQ